jgi:uncharacterized protein (DUF1800 family)
MHAMRRSTSIRWEATMSNAEQAAIALTRFGLGARPGDLSTIAGDARGWLARQIERPDAFALRSADLPDRTEAAQALADFLEERRTRRDRRAAPQEGVESPASMTDAPNRSAIAAYTGILRREIVARGRRAAATNDPYAERLVHFWSNHFTVAVQKATVVPFAGLYEREVIRGGLTGSFADLALAAARHPAMLLYLDQAQSAGPNSAAGRRRGAGLNENLAREILELHLLGPQGGYSQADVTEFAKALTGWTIAGPRLQRFTGDAPQGAFVFVDAMHEPGPRMFMGKRYPEAGEAQARAMLLDAARQPACARRVSERLVRHVIADAPPPRAVEALERVFLETEGDLASLHKALIGRPEAWAVEQRKFKTPNEFIISSLRALDISAPDPVMLTGAFEILGQQPFRAPSPEGWADDAPSWAAPDAVMKRLEWAEALAARTDARARPEAVAEAALGPLLASGAREAIQRAESSAQGLVLMLMSPEFQRR